MENQLEPLTVSLVGNSCRHPDRSASVARLQMQRRAGPASRRSHACKSFDSNAALAYVSKQPDFNFSASTSHMAHEDPESDHSELTAGSAEFDFDRQTLESVTELIQAAQNGQAGAWDRVYALLYKELHKVAGLHLRRRGGDRSPTSLINRTWLRLNQNEVTLNNRQHLLSVLSRAMRYAVLDEVRRLQTSKRAEHYHPDELEHAPEPSHDPELDQLVAIDRALTDLAVIDARLGQVVEMRYFAGMNEAEIAEVLGVTERTVRRDWRKARAFLAATLG